LLGFALGTLLGALGFLTAYLTPLHYGRGGESFRPAHWWHRATYALVILCAFPLCGVAKIRAESFVRSTRSRFDTRRGSSSVAPVVKPRSRKAAVARRKV
jgi:hypothetical protein